MTYIVSGWALNSATLLSTHSLRLKDKDIKLVLEVSLYKDKDQRPCVSVKGTIIILSETGIHQPRTINK